MCSNQQSGRVTGTMTVKLPCENKMLSMCSLSSSFMPWIWKLPFDYVTAKTNCVNVTITNLLENKEESSAEDTEGSLFGGSVNGPYSSASAQTIKVFILDSILKCNVQRRVWVVNFSKAPGVVTRLVSYFSQLISQCSLISFCLLLSLLQNLLGNHLVTGICPFKRGKKLCIILQEGLTLFVILRSIVS